MAAPDSPGLGANDRRLLRDATSVIGVDEVGRGALAGPVVVCAAAFASIPDDPEVRDSKLLRPKARERVARRLLASGMRWAICEVWVELVDRLNVLEATRLAMRAAVEAVVSPDDVVITDHVKLAALPCRSLSPTGADRSYFSVAAASIVAKVHRDRIMDELGLEHPHWDWQSNKGYGTQAHRLALQEVGSGAWHRRSFRWSPVLP